MTTTISNGTTSFYPDIVTGYQAETQSGNVLHDVVDQASKSYTLAAEGLRSGTLEMVFSSYASAWAARSHQAGVHTFTLTDSDWPNIGMKYVRAGAMRIRLDQDTLSTWILEVEFQEVV